MRHLHSMTSDWIRPEAYLIHVLFPTSIKYIERFICGFFSQSTFHFHKMNIFQLMFNSSIKRNRTEKIDTHIDLNIV